MKITMQISTDFGAVVLEADNATELRHEIPGVRAAIMSLLGRPTQNEEPQTGPQTPPAPPAESAPAEPQVVGSITPAETPDTPPVVVTYKDVADAITAYGAKHGIPAARTLLGEFGAVRASDIPEEKWAAFIGKTKENVE